MREEINETPPLDDENEEIKIKLEFNAVEELKNAGEKQSDEKNQPQSPTSVSPQKQTLRMTTMTTI